MTGNPGIQGYLPLGHSYVGKSRQVGLRGKILEFWAVCRMGLAGQVGCRLEILEFNLPLGLG